MRPHGDCDVTGRKDRRSRDARPEDRILPAARDDMGFLVEQLAWLRLDKEVRRSNHQVQLAALQALRCNLVRQHELEPYARRYCYQSTCDARENRSEHVV